MIDEIKAISLIDPGHTQPRIIIFGSRDDREGAFCRLYIPPLTRPLLLPYLEWLHRLHRPGGRRKRGFMGGRNFRFLTLCSGYGSHLRRTPPPLADVKTSTGISAPLWLPRYRHCIRQLDGVTDLRLHIAGYPNGESHISTHKTPFPKLHYKVRIDCTSETNRTTSQ